MHRVIVRVDMAAIQRRGPAMGELVLKSADAIITTLIAIVESDRSEN